MECFYLFHQPINETSRKMPLKITYSPISVGKLRLWVNMQESMKQLHALGQLFLFTILFLWISCSLTSCNYRNFSLLISSSTMLHPQQLED